MQREESNCSARSSTEEWRTSEAEPTIQRTFWVASHCCCGIGQSCMPMSCWKLRVANAPSTRRRSRLRFDCGGEVRLYDESLHVHDLPSLCSVRRVRRIFHTRPRRLPRIANSKFRIHALEHF